MNIKEFEASLKEAIKRAINKDMGTFDMEIDIFQEYIMGYKVDIDIRNTVLEARKSNDVYSVVDDEVHITSQDAHEQKDFDTALEETQIIVDLVYKAILEVM